MGEYARLNKHLSDAQKRYDKLKEKPGKTEDDYEDMADLQQSIGEIRGALLELADIDGLDDPYEAFDIDICE